MARLVPALTRGLDVLELFIDSPRPLSVPEVVARTGLPRTTVHGLVTTLVAREYLRRAPDDPSKLQLGVRVFQLGSVYGDGLDLAREGQEVAREVASLCDETVNVATLDGTDVIYIATVPSTHAVRMVATVGRRLPAHCTALGKVLLADLSEEALVARYPSGEQLPALTPHTVTSMAGLRRGLAQVRTEGVARENREANDAVTCHAAPVRDHTGAVVAAMSIAVPVMRWSAEREPELTRLVRDGAARLSTRLGHRGTDVSGDARQSG